MTDLMKLCDEIEAPPEPQRIDQTEFGENGNCMSACLAMMLGIKIDKVPNFAAMNLSLEDHHAALQAWLASKGFTLLTFQKWDGPLWPPKGFMIAGGKSPRGDYLHAIVIKDGELWHDPHPDRDGVVAIETVDIIYPLFPAAKPLIDAARESVRLRGDSNALLNCRLGSMPCKVSTDLMAVIEVANDELLNLRAELNKVREERDEAILALKAKL